MSVEAMPPSHPRSARPAAPARSAAALRAAGMTAHAVALCLLCYAASVYLVDVTGILMSRAGMWWIDAVFAASMLGFLYLLVILLWAFSRRGVLRAWLSVGALTALAACAAWLLTGGAR